MNDTPNLPIDDRFTPDEMLVELLRTAEQAIEHDNRGLALFNVTMVRESLEARFQS